MTPVEMFGGVEFPRDRRAAVPADARPARLLLVLARAAGRDGAGRARRCRSSSSRGHWPQIVESARGTRGARGASARLAARRGAGSARRRDACARRRSRTSIRVPDPSATGAAPPAGYLVLVRAEFTEGDRETYLVPLTASALERYTRAHALAGSSLALLHCGDGELVLHEPLHEPPLRARAARSDPRAQAPAGQRRAALVALARPRHAQPARRDTSSRRCCTPSRATRRSCSATASILKLFRRVEEGENPDVEISRALTERTALANVAPLRGSLEYRPPRGEPSTLALLQEYVPNEGDAWRFTLDSIDRFFEDALALGGEPPLPDGLARSSCRRSEPPALAHDTIGGYLESARALGQRTAELHAALHSIDDPAFAPEPLTLMARRALYQSMRTLARQVFATLPPARRASCAGSAALLEREAEVPRALQAAARPDAGRRAHARARRLPPRPGAVDRQGLRDHRLRGRAGAHASASAGSSARRCATSPACCARSTTPPTPACSPSSACPRGSARTSIGGSAARDGHPAEIAQAPVAERWARFWYAWSAASFLRAYLESARAAGFLPGTDHDVDGAARRAHAREGRLRAALRGEQPARLGADPGARHPPAARGNALMAQAAVARGARRARRAVRPPARLLGRERHAPPAERRGDRWPCSPRSARRSTRPTTSPTPRASASARSGARSPSRSSRSSPASPLELSLRVPAWAIGPRARDARARGRRATGASSSSSARCRDRVDRAVDGEERRELRLHASRPAAAPATTSCASRRAATPPTSS